MASGNAKRRAKQQHQKQHSADKQHHRQQTHQHDHLPKVGTPADDAYLQRRRREDLVDFGLWKSRNTQIAGVLIAALAVIVLVVFMVAFL